MELKMAPQMEPIPVRREFRKGTQNGTILGTPARRFWRPFYGMRGAWGRIKEGEIEVIKLAVIG